MGREEIYDILDRTRDWMSTTDISRVSGIGKSTVIQCLLRMQKGSYIECRVMRGKYSNYKEWKVIIDDEGN